MKKFAIIFLLLIYPVLLAHSQTTSYYLVMKELQVISATKEPVSYDSIPRFVKVITREEIDKWQAYNLFELLKHLPEFYVYRSQIFLKAIGAFGVKQSYFSEKVQVFIDGVPLTDPSNGSSFSTNQNISLNNVKRVEIVYGPMTSLYGVNSCLAIINLITYDTKDVKNLKAGIRINTDFSNDSYFIKSFKKGKLSGTFSLNYREDRGPHESYVDWTGRSSDLSAYFKHLTYYLRLKHDSGFYLNFYGVDRDNNFPLNIVGIVVNDKSYTRRKAFINRFGYKRDIDKLHFDVYTYFDWFYIKRGYNICPVDICSQFFLDSLYAVEERAIRNPGVGTFITYNTSFGKISGGADLNVVQLYRTNLSANFIPSSLSFDISKIKIIPFQKLPPSDILMDRVSRTIISPYLQYQFIKKTYSFLVNFRLDKLNDVGSAKTASFSFRYKLSDIWTFKLNTGRAVRAPSFEEMYIKNNPILQGNRNLDFEKVDSFMPSVEYRGETLSGSLLIYLNRFKDLIYKQTLVAGTQQWKNYEHPVLVKGIIFSLRKRLNNFEIYGGFNKIFSITDIEDTTFLSYPDWKLNGGISYEEEKFSWDVNFEGYSRIKKGNIKEVPGYGLVNFNFLLKPKSSLKLTFKVNNLLDKKVIYPFYKTLAPSNLEGMVGEGRNLWVGLEVSF
ncbi:TonB-dependent receptor plug domain-containing protein [Desulfurobacterium thermolithotrophum]|uniref:TonB-dependent receptor plug domain-containing protein n=1 Tax=Desulfurobacterium thermolithotrophum TaxID=64160 RepID=UPI0013D214FD|nr:TonB-dependent receptor [Desulfurobacterium thermolithotrophum]